MDIVDEYASLALGFKGSKPIKNESFNPHQHPDILVRYSTDQLIQVFKKIKKTQHPLLCLSSYHLPERPSPQIEDIFFSLFRSKPNMNLEVTESEGIWDQSQFLSLESCDNFIRNPQKSSYNERKLEPLPSVYRATDSYEDDIARPT